MSCTLSIPTRPRETSSETQLGKVCFTKDFEGFQVTVRFCTRHKSLSGHLCGPTSRRRKKSKDSQCFRRILSESKGCVLDALRGPCSSHQRQVAANHAFTIVFEGFLVTVRFSGAEFLLASAKRWFLQRFCSISGVGVFFGHLQ